MPDNTEQTIVGDQQRTIPLSRIVVPDVHDPRKHSDEAVQAALNASVAERGILKPIRVAQTPTGDYALIAGERRYRAAIACSQADTHDDHTRGVVSDELTILAREALRELAQLAPRPRQAFELHVARYDHAEIDGLTGDSRRTVDRQLRRARDQIRWPPGSARGEFHRPRPYRAT